MKQAHHLCENCLRRGIYKPAEIVHHIIEIDPVTIERPEIALNFDNLEAVCRDCHNDIHGSYGRWYKVNEAKREAKRRSQRYEIDQSGKVTAR